MRSLLGGGIFAVLGGAAVSSGNLLFAQEARPTSAAPVSGQEKIRVNSNLVILPVTVKDLDGNLVPDMERQDFRVFDDNVEQSIDVFTAEDFPLSLVVLVDDDLRNKDATQLVASLRTLTAGISSADEAMICHFDTMFYGSEKFSSDEGVLLAQLNEAKDASGPSKQGPVPFVTGPSSHVASPGEPITMPIAGGNSRATKALDDAVFAAVELLRARDNSHRKIILLISDGIDGPLFNRHTYEETATALLHENITVYGLAVGSDSFQKKFGRMRDYADRSGGDLYFAAKSDAMEKLYSQMTEQARHEYTLAYQPQGNSTKTDYHVVRVVTAQRGLSVKTRQGYFANSAVNPPAIPAVAPAEK
jgi:Ca-activated chloride channel homolog